MRKSKISEIGHFSITFQVYTGISSPEFMRERVYPTLRLLCTVPLHVCLYANTLFQPPHTLKRFLASTLIYEH